MIEDNENILAAMQKKQLEILYELDRICKKNSLNYHHPKV